ncbi:MAG: aspartate/tyrosine/aromatic aminotransferase [Chlamydiales bacterium]|nr:aspartate/tyrosine/aromatic aminotransferase [Chlamydiales bacterium]
MQDVFSAYRHLPLDPIFFLSAEAVKDPRPNKVDLTMGIYRDDSLNSGIFKSIKEAERQLFKDESNKDYLPIAGSRDLISETELLVFGKNKEGSAGIQTLGGTGALRVGADLLKQVASTVYLPKPTWINHYNIFTYAGFQVREYAYYDRATQSLSFEVLCSQLEQAAEHSVVVLHGCCHNPSGMDPTPDQWKTIAQICQRGNLIPFFDLAYLGFGDGLNEDPQAIRTFAEMGLPILVAVSYSKNLGLYGERTGVLLTLPGVSYAENVKSQLQALARGSYSNPPRHGGLLAAAVLSDSQLRALWIDELDSMRVRMQQLRKNFAHALTAAVPSQDFQYLNHCKGMFSYLNLEEKQVSRLKELDAIYLTGSGRVNISGLNPSNMDRVVEAIKKVYK